MTDWLEIHRGTAPLIVSLPHTGTDIPAEIQAVLPSAWIARKDADWWVDRLYAFARVMGATTVRTRLSRTAIDVNRDPSGASLYPGQTTTGLCPVETFDGEPLYAPGQAPDAAEIARRRAAYFQPYHDALTAEIARLRGLHPAIVLYEAHSIRSHVPRLFDGALPQFNIGTNNDTTCGNALTNTVESLCARSGMSHVRNGRFKGGWITRHYSDVPGGVHTLQMELACRGYMHEPASIDESNWPMPYDPAHAAPLRDTLHKVLRACLDFASWRT